jgi:hypothetical protein
LKHFKQQASCAIAEQLQVHMSGTCIQADAATKVVNKGDIAHTGRRCNKRQVMRIAAWHMHLSPGMSRTTHLKGVKFCPLLLLYVLEQPDSCLFHAAEWFCARGRVDKLTKSCSVRQQRSGRRQAGFNGSVTAMRR